MSDKKKPVKRIKRVFINDDLIVRKKGGYYLVDIYLPPKPYNVDTAKGNRLVTKTYLVRQWAINKALEYVTDGNLVNSKFDELDAIKLGEIVK